MPQYLLLLISGRRGGGGRGREQRGRECRRWLAGVVIPCQPTRRQHLRRRRAARRHRRRRPESVCPIRATAIRTRQRRARPDAPHWDRRDERRGVRVRLVVLGLQEVLMVMVVVLPRRPRRRRIRVNLAIAVVVVLVCGVERLVEAVEAQVHRVLYPAVRHSGRSDRSGRR